jgi:hypothetical protein
MAEWVGAWETLSHLAARFYTGLEICFNEVSCFDIRAKGVLLTLHLPLRFLHHGSGKQVTRRLRLRDVAERQREWRAVTKSN